MELLTDDSKELGNACMKEEKYVEAMLHYTRGIKVDPQSPHLYSNRSLAFLRMEQYYHALEDAQTAIQMMPKWVKGYFRKGEIECAAEHYAEAIESYKQGLALLPDDTSLLKALDKAQSLWLNQRRTENRMPWCGIALGAVIAISLIVLDEAIASKQPILGTDFVRTIVLISITSICYGFAVLYRFFLTSQRKDLLSCPPDLLGDNFLNDFVQAEPSLSVDVDQSANLSAARKSSQQRKKGRSN